MKYTIYLISQFWIFKFDQSESLTLLSFEQDVTILFQSFTTTTFVVLVVESALSEDLVLEEVLFESTVTKGTLSATSQKSLHSANGDQPKSQARARYPTKKENKILIIHFRPRAKTLVIIQIITSPTKIVKIVWNNVIFQKKVKN